MKLEILNKELENLFSTIEFEEDGGIYITGTDWYSDELRVEFVIKTGIEGENQLWEVQIGGVRDELIKSDITDRLELFEEHPILWAHNQRQVDLYFGHPTTSPYELFANIYSVHVRETKNRIPFEKYFSGRLSLIELLKSPSGLLMRGPIKLAEAYMSELKKYNMNPTILNGHDPKRWLNGAWVDETEIVKVLVIGKSYVVGETFEFNRV